MPALLSIRFVLANAAVGQANNTPVILNGQAVYANTFTNCNCTSGSPNLTRASGGLSAIPLGSALSGTLQARFPANSYVNQITSDTSVVMRSGIANANAISNGTGTESATLTFSPTDKFQDSLFPMTNLLLDDRYVVYKLASDVVSGLFIVDIDLGSSKSISFVGVHNIRNNLASGGTVTVYSQATSRYAPSIVQNNGSGSWLPFATFGCPDSTTSADGGAQLTSPLNARFWRFQFGGSLQAGTTIGKFLLGSSLVDVGKMFSGGTTEAIVRTRSHSSTMTNQSVIYELGPSHRRYKLNLGAMDVATTALVRSMAQADSRPNCALVIPSDTMTIDQLYEVTLGSDEVEFTKRFGLPGLQDCTIELEQLA